eukprot:CAMPEP_0196754590 /NCGR_PEP_ID=MMETSP1091-20130531/94459_1 /TAXON_ID=302021 /ORGANISM="Rhodomonas sp., Strain CCMP768" /LENGTH=105 /DNA_ID=CAMNT_0042102875 /DNA_START=13 /DNA_END=327 /DNA_ORIENTATION=+
MITQEVFLNTSELEFNCRLSRVGNSVVGWGVVDCAPAGHNSHIIWHTDVLRSYGAVGDARGGGKIVVEKTLLGEVPQIVDGDVVGVLVRDQRCRLTHNGVVFHTI